MKVLQIFSDLDEQRIHDTAVEILQSAKAVQGKGMRLKDLLPAIHAKVGPELAQRVYPVLLAASKNDSSPVRSGGPWRGYFLGQTLTEEESLDDKEEVKAGKVNLLEADLYPLVGFWLKSKKSYKNVSSVLANNRGGGWWGNPDIIALNQIKRFGLSDLEVATVEVKVASSGWKHNLFEAVAHKRFADRVYYVYRSPDGMSSFDSEMYLYAEKFGVGIGVIDVPDDRVPDLKKWPQLDDALKYEFADSVVEVVPAPVDQVAIRDKCIFLEQIKIRYEEDIPLFGNL